MTPTVGELFWLWRKRCQRSVEVAAAHLNVTRFAYVEAEHDRGTLPVDAPALRPTLAELLRLYRRRSSLARDDLAARVGVSHMTYLKWERNADPRLVRLWTSD